jgi:hypothetical protein
MAQQGIQGSGVRSEEKKSGGSQSTPLRSRHSVRPSNPGYDAFVLEFIKSKMVVDANGCWLWQGFIAPRVPLKTGKGAGKVSKGGYGSIGYRGRNLGVHRVVWMIHNGPQPKGMHVCHSCDVRRCVNPDHLWLGTNRENITDMVKKGRGPCGEKATKTHCIRGHAFAEYAYYSPSYPTWRKCRECDRLHHKTEKNKQWVREYQRKNRDKRNAQKRAYRQRLRARQEQRV